MCCFFFLTDFLILSSVLINGAEQLCKEKTKQVIIHQPLIWIHIQYFYLKNTYQIFMDLLKSEESLIEKLVETFNGKSSETRVELSAASIILDMLEPSESMLLPFEKCLDWLKRVKSFKHLVEQILSAEHRLPYTEGGQHMLKTISDRWYYMKIIFLLIDHLLHEESAMEEKFLRIAVMRLIFLWTKLKKILDQRNIAKSFELVTNELKQVISRATNHYFLKGVSKCKMCKSDIKTPAELPCGHIFCVSCLKDRIKRQCPECKKDSGQDFIPKELVITRKAIESYNKFITSCNSFFVEFVSTYCFAENISLSTEIIDKLITFVAYKPPESRNRGSQKDYKSVSEIDLSTFEACMDPSPMVNYNILNMLLRCRTEAVEANIEKYIPTMDSTANDYSDFCFMVVRCVEDFFHSSLDEGNTKTIEEHLSIANLSLLSPDDVSRFKKLELIARLRFAISVTATLVGSELQRDERNESISCSQQSEERRRLVESLKRLLETSTTPWLRVFLIRRLHAVHGFGIMKNILHQENWHWILPPDIDVSEMKTQSFSDNFLIHGAIYNEIIIKHLRNGEENRSFLVPYFQEIQDGASDKLISLALAASRELINKKTSSEAKILEALLTHQDQYPELARVTPVCKVLTENKLTGDTHLLEVIIHAVLVITLSKTKIAELFKSICLDPSKIKESYIPTMPEDNLFAANQMKKTERETIWACSCGEIWILENCGQPWEIGKCKCGANIGGERHKAVHGFIQINTSTDKTEKGYLLDDPQTRKPDEHARNLAASSFCICRVLLHASMLWGSLTDEQSIRNIMKVKVQNLNEFFFGHLQKDMEFLASYIGSNTDDAVLAIHLFLKFIFNYSTEIILNIESTDNKESRNKWEDCLKSIIQIFLQQGFESTLNSAKQQITEHGPPALLKTIHSQSALCNDFQTAELVNMPYMWRSERRRTVEHLKHLLDQEDGQNRFPLLMELLTEKNISYIKQLPDILRFQLFLIHLFQNCDMLKWKGKSIGQFMDSDDVTDEQRCAFKGACRTIQRVWINIRATGLRVHNSRLKEINDDSEMLDLLPTNTSIIYSVAQSLIELQNRLIDMAISITKERKMVISAEEVKPLFVISCVPEKDVVSIALSNIQHVLEEDGTDSTLYNFRALQRQVINQYISGKPTLEAQTVPCITRNEMTMNSTIKKVKEQVKIQDPLSFSGIKRIMEEVKSVSDLSSVLATLKVTAELLAVMGGDPECLITTYVREKLKMGNEIKHFKALPVVPQAQLKHILSLWQILLARRSVLLVEMNQNPFFFMPSDYQDDLSSEEEAAVRKSLSTVNIDDFILELHEMIMICQERFLPHFCIVECFTQFLSEKNMEEAHIQNLTGTLDPELKMKKIIAVWKMAVQIHKLHTPDL